jgi:glycosyltransferase involved in cell wall biosynthesis
MNIAVNTRFLLKDQMEGYGYFISEVFVRLAASHPEHRFYFLFDRPVADGFTFPQNVETIVIGPPARLPLLWKYWYDVRVPWVLKKVRADVFVSPDGMCSLTTRIPQCLVIHDIGIIHHPGDYRHAHSLFYRAFLPRFLKKAKMVATVSEFSKKDILKTYRADPSKITVVYSAVKEIFRPLDDSAQQTIRDLWTEGKAYFIYVGAIHPRKNLVNLLKAFSIFKKRLQSNMKLVLVGRMAWKKSAFESSLKNYKYRNDVVLTGYLKEEDVSKLIASSYALVYPSSFEGFGVPVLEAMKCGVPALTSKGSSMEEIAGDAALYFDPHDPQDIGEQLMRIYKDEKLRKEQIENGRTISSNYTWQRTASLVWDAIMKTVSG